MSTSSANVCAAEPALEEQRQLAAVWVRPLVALALTGIITIVLLRSTPVSMVKIWYGSSTYSYGFVVVPIAAFLVWRRRRDLKSLYPATSFVGLALVLVLAMVWAVGNIADVQVIQQFAFIGLLDALVWAFLGNSAVRVLRFALLFLFFCVPAGQGLVGPLQRLTAAFAVNAVRLTGVPAILSGFVISTPSGDWRIAEACSGIRYLTSSVLIGVLFAGIAFRSWKRRVALVLLSVVVPIVANALRAYLIILLAYFSNNRLAAGVDHVMYGWVFFSLITAMMIGLALGWREPPASFSDPALQANLPTPTPTGVARLAWCSGLAVLIVVAASSITDYLWSRTPPSQPLEKIWSAPAGWFASQEADHDWAPHFEDIQSENALAFTQDGRQVSIYVVLYTSKRRGVSLVNSSNAMDVSGDWELIDGDFRQVKVAGRPMTVAEYLVARAGQRRVVWMWYLAGKELTSNPYKIKLMQAESRLAGNPQNVTLFAVSAPFASKPTEAVENLSNFVRNLSLPSVASRTP